MRYVVQWSIMPYIWRDESTHDDYCAAISAAQRLRYDYTRVIDHKSRSIIPVRKPSSNHNTNREECNTVHKRLTSSR